MLPLGIKKPPTQSTVPQKLLPMFQIKLLAQFISINWVSTSKILHYLFSFKNTKETFCQVANKKYLKGFKNCLGAWIYSLYTNFRKNWYKYRC